MGGKDYLPKSIRVQIPGERVHKENPKEASKAAIEKLEDMTFIYKNVDCGKWMIDIN